MLYEVITTDLLEVAPEHTVLEVGTGLGYQAAVLAQLAERVFSVEMIDELADEAKRRLADFRFKGLKTRLGDPGICGDNQLLPAFPSLQARSRAGQGRCVRRPFRNVITSYSIHYTKLYDRAPQFVF